MNLIVKKTAVLNGKTIPPGSKSQSIRAIILALLCEGKSTAKNILFADDTQNAIDVCKNLGAKISQSQDTLMINSMGIPLKNVETPMYTGSSGVTTHFVMPILGLRQDFDQPIVLDCSEQMRARPIKSFVDTLTELGLHIHYLKNKNAFPLRISGQLTGGKATVDGVTSQYLSALLIALPCASNDSEISVYKLQERPYVDMTLNWLKAQKIQYQHVLTDEVDTFKIMGRQHYKNFNTTIPSDFSSASYLIAASALIPGEVILEGLNINDSQGDKKLIQILQAMGADIAWKSNNLVIRGGKKLSGIKIDANDIPDLFPTLAVIGTYASGKTEIENVAHARIKETDRIQSMAEGLSRMGAKMEEKRDGMTIYQSVLKGAEVKGYGDHRTVMALSVAGMISEGETIIENCEAINKTFPSFIHLMQSIGAQMEIEDATTTAS